jgi:hypothetical protein
VADFLSTEWFESVNETLRAAGPVEVDGDVVRVVLELLDAPASLPHAMTLTLGGEETSLRVGDHLAADALVRLSYADALALNEGTLDSASALRDGRLKIRGDIHAIVPLLGWLKAAHPLADQ